MPKADAAPAPHPPRARPVPAPCPPRARDAAPGPARDPCAASPPRCQREPLHAFRTCVDGTAHLLDLARGKGARFLQASASEACGDPEVSPQPASDRGQLDTFGPRACRDDGKRAAETLIRECARPGVAARVARIFNTDGPRRSPEDGRAVSAFVVAARRGQELPVHGDGTQTRSFCYVDDVVEGLARPMASDCEGPVTLGEPGEPTMPELARRVLGMTGSASRLAVRPLPQDDPRQRRPDIGRAEAGLGWAPRVTLARGLEATIAHFRAERGAAARGTTPAV